MGCSGKANDRALSPRRFIVDQLTAEQYLAPVEFTANYFAAGYEFYTPLALRVRDQDALRMRFERAR